MSGPQFLFVYALLAVAANVWLRRFLRRREAAKPARFLEFAQDPYLVAQLRGGGDEAPRLAVFSLIDRGLLDESAGLVRRSRDDAAELARRPLEKAVLSCCADWENVEGICCAIDVRAARTAYESELRSKALVADEQLFAERSRPYAAVLALLLGVAAARISWAVSQGHHNIIFLIIMALAAALALTIGLRRRRTGLGDAALDRLQKLFAKLRRNVEFLVPGGQSNDAVLTAAVFGMAVLPIGSFPYLRRVFPKPESSNDSGGGGDAGGSGGGCGGGGCGGCGG